MDWKWSQSVWHTWIAIKKIWFFPHTLSATSSAAYWVNWVNNGSKWGNDSKILFRTNFISPSMHSWWKICIKIWLLLAERPFISVSFECVEQYEQICVEIPKVLLWGWPHCLPHSHIVFKCLVPNFRMPFTPSTVDLF